MIHTNKVHKIYDSTNIREVAVTYSQGRVLTDEYISTVYINNYSSTLPVSSKIVCNLMGGHLYMYSVLNIPFTMSENDYNKICETLLKATSNSYVAVDLYFQGMYFPAGIVFITGYGRAEISTDSYRTVARIIVQGAEEVNIEKLGVALGYDSYIDINHKTPNLPAFSMEYWKRKHGTPPGLTIVPPNSNTSAKYITTCTIIPVRGDSKTLLSTLTCFQRIYSSYNTRSIFIVLVWSDFDEKYWKVIQKYFAGQDAFLSRITLIKEDGPLGFAAAVNKGIKHYFNTVGTMMTINIVNDDILITPLVYYAMNLFAYNIGYSAIIGPVSNNIAGYQKVLDMNISEYSSYEQYANERFNRLGQEFVSSPIVMGTYWVCTPNFFQQRGLLDEEYGVGNWEDNDLCARNVLSGGLNIIANGCAVYHFGQQTFNRENINYDETLKKGEERFRSKYPHYALSSNS